MKLNKAKKFIKKITKEVESMGYITSKEVDGEYIILYIKEYKNQKGCNCTIDFENGIFEASLSMDGAYILKNEMDVDVILIILLHLIQLKFDEER